MQEYLDVAMLLIEDENPDIVEDAVIAMYLLSVREIEIPITQLLNTPFTTAHQ